MADVKLSAGRKALQTSLFDAQNRMMYDIQKGIGRMFVYAQMPVSKTQEVLSQRWLGGNYSGRVWTDTQKLAQEIETCVMENTMAGKTSEQTYQNLLDLCGQDMRKTNRLIRTETSYAANQGEKYAYEQANIKEYEFVSALEARTCEICGGLDGKRFPVNASKPGKNFPPMHPHCRCTTMPYDKDLEAILTDEDTRWARDPETGEAYEVPMKMTYEEWKKKQQEISGIDSVDVARKKLYSAQNGFYKIVKKWYNKREGRELCRGVKYRIYAVFEH